MTITTEQARQRRAEWVQKNPDKAKAAADRWRANNRDQAREASLKHYRENADKVNAAAAHRNRKRKFGVTREEFESLLRTQDHKCAICKKPETATRKGKLKSLAVDHNHTTGKVRGLLCMACNIMIGNGREDSEVLRSAISYLEKHSEERTCPKS
jgi:hypothetical protein